MPGETVITVIGNLGGPPELRFTPSGAAVCNFSVGSTPSTFNKETQQWEDGETLWLRCNVWREAAENAAETLDKGMRVIVQGRLKSRTFETKEGEKRTVTELDVDEVGPSLRYASAQVRKTPRGDGQGGGFGGGQQGGGRPQGRPPQGGPPRQMGGRPPQGVGQGRRPSTSTQTAPADQVWGQGSGGNYDWGAGQEEEPPF